MRFIYKIKRALQKRRDARDERLLEEVDRELAEIDALMKTVYEELERKKAVVPRPAGHKTELKERRKRGADISVRPQKPSDDHGTTTR